MFNHILVPLDGSEFAERALQSAFSLAEAYGGARVTLLAVMLRYPESKLHVHKVDEQSEARGKEYLRGLIERVGPKSVPVDCLVKLGVPAQEIVRTVKDAKADLIVMSTHGTTGIERDQRSIGSTAWRVLQDAPCPILLLPAQPAG